jgi:hypothetical protein
MSMASAPPTLKIVSAQAVLGLLTKSKADPTFRDKLIASPAATLEGEGLRPTPTLIAFFKGLTPANFVQEVEKAETAMNHPLVQGEASVGSVAEAIV